MTESNPPDEKPEDDDPFKEFEDWLVDGPAGPWPETWEDKELSRRQNHIVQRNADLLIDPNRQAWDEKVSRFDAALAVLGDKETIDAKRTEYAIHFDRHSFGDGKNDFSSIYFPCSVSFEGATFSKGGISFRGAKFGEGDVSFEYAVFQDIENIDFREATFSEGKLSFNGSFLPDSLLNLSGLIIDGDLDCENISALDVWFWNTRVRGLVDCTGAEFGKIPDFCHMNSDVLPDTTRMSVPKPNLVSVLQSGEKTGREIVHGSGWFLIAQDSEDVQKLRKLKAMAIAASDHEKDGEFFAYEMMAKRGVEHTTFWQLLANTIYWKVSFYGQSYLRPLAWMLANFGVFAVIYTLMAALPIGGWNSFWFGITYSLKNSLPFLGTITRSVPSLDDPQVGLLANLKRSETYSRALIGSPFSAPARRY